MTYRNYYDCILKLHCYKQKKNFFSNGMENWQREQIFTEIGTFLSLKIN